MFRLIGIVISTLFVALIAAFLLLLPRQIPAD